MYKLPFDAAKVAEEVVRLRDLKVDGILDEDIQEYANYIQALPTLEADENGVIMLPSGEFNFSNHFSMFRDGYTFTDYNRRELAKAINGWEWPENNDAGCEYGVADNTAQIAKRFGPFSEDVFCTASPVYREDQPEQGGWRWHKWGEYIGTQGEGYEYLYDEKKVDMVLVFRIYERLTMMNLIEFKAAKVGDLVGYERNLYWPHAITGFNTVKGEVEIVQKKGPNIITGEDDNTPFVVKYTEMLSPTMFKKKVANDR